VQRKFKGAIVASNRHLDLKESTHCTTAAQPLPASSLFNGLRGDYLPVACRTEAGPRGPVERRLAFLLTSGLYVQLEESQEWQFSKAAIGGASYGKPSPAPAKLSGMETTAQAGVAPASSPPR
jgi:hypothetical protein